MDIFRVGNVPVFAAMRRIFHSPGRANRNAGSAACCLSVELTRFVLAPVRLPLAQESAGTALWTRTRRQMLLNGRLSNNSIPLAHFGIILGLSFVALGLRPSIAHGQNIITTVAGDGYGTFSGDGGLATAAALNLPKAVVADSEGNLYIADSANYVIRKVDKNGIISTIAGTPGVSGYTGNGGPAVNAEFAAPTSLALDNAGNLYVVDGPNCVVREVAISGIITTVAGNPTCGPLNGAPNFGDGGPATNAGLEPQGVAIDNSGNIYIADYAYGAIREVTNGIITTIAQNTGTNPLFNPYDVAVDSGGNVFIADVDANGTGWVLKLTAGKISDVAGGVPLNYSGASYGDNGPATSADIGLPIGVWVDSSENIYIADSFNNAIRKVAPNGIITTVAGGPDPDAGDYSGDGGPATSALLNSPYGVSVDSSGIVYIADTYNNRIRAVTAAVMPVSPLLRS